MEFRHKSLRDDDKSFLPIVALTDCKSVYDALNKEGGLRIPSEKRLILDLAAIKEIMNELERPGDACEAFRGPLRWIPTELMLADGMTKVMKNDAIRKLLQEGTLELPLLDSREKWLGVQKLGAKDG